MKTMTHKMPAWEFLKLTNQLEKVVGEKNLKRHYQKKYNIKKLKFLKSRRLFFILLKIAQQQI